MAGIKRMIEEVQAAAEAAAVSGNMTSKPTNTALIPYWNEAFEYMQGVMEQEYAAYDYYLNQSV